jgi:hypothetical protein
VSISRPTLETSDHTCLSTVCSSHHRQYDGGYFVFVPGQSQRKVLLDHEHSDFAHRESLIANGQPDPGRTLPNVWWKCLDAHLEISDEKEYIPIHATRFHPYVHTPTRYDPTIFLFDTQDQSPCPPLHFQADPICLMVQAQPHLANVLRLETDRAAAAQWEVTTLLELYKRLPGGRQNSPTTVPAAYQPASLKLPLNNRSSTHVLPTIPSSPPPSHPFTSAPPRQHHLEMPGLTPARLQA